MSKIPCEVIQDLLPSYIDELTSDVTNEEIENHLNDCENCSEVLRSMKAPEMTVESNEEKAEINFLKKTKSGVMKAIVGCMVAAVLVTVGVLFTRIYLTGNEISGEYIAYDIAVDGQTLTLKGGAISDNMAVRRVKFAQQDHRVIVYFIGAKKSLFSSNHFEEQYIATEEIKEVYFGKRCVWAEGEMISPITASLFQTAHPYIGDMSANGASAKALNMGGYLGNFRNELQTSEQPYEWKMKLETSHSASRAEAMEQRMKAYAYALLAVIDNLDIVTYEYQIGEASRTLTVTSKEATAYVGFPIKEAGKDVRFLELLIQKTGLNNLAFVADSMTEIAGDTMQIRVASFSKTPIAGMGMTVSVDGEVKCSPTTIHADESPFWEGEITSFELLPEDFGGEIWSGTKPIEIQIRVTDTDGNEQMIDQTITVDAAFGNVYRMDITGDMDEGYTIQSR